MIIRKITISLVAIAAAVVTALPTDLSARGRGGVGGARSGGHISGGHISGGHISGRHFGGYRSGFGYRPYYYSGGYGYSCWRWQETLLGPRRVWVCGDSYSYYGYPY
jgi:hypothetical protein